MLMRANIEARPYQTRAVAAILGAIKKHRRVLFVMPTATGKTVVAARVIRELRKAGKSILFLAHRKEILDQAVSKLTDDGIRLSDIGVIRGNHEHENLDAPIQVASVQRIHRSFLDIPPEADVIFIDEAHRAAAESYREILELYPNAIIIGLTATPERLGTRRSLKDAFDVLIEGAKPSEMVKQGYLAKPRIFTAHGPAAKPDLRGVKVRRGDYALGALGEAMSGRSITGSIVEHWLRLAKGIKTVCFSCDVAHSQKIVAAFRQAGVRAEHLDGTATEAQRVDALDRLRHGKIDVLSNCDLFIEGWDMPEVQCVILARPTKSRTLHLQQCGRPLRPFGKLRPIILDHADNCIGQGHGIPIEDVPWSLDARPKGQGAPCKACPECDAVLPSGAAECPECGRVFPRAEPDRSVSEAAGKLQELNLEAYMEDRRRAMERARRVAKEVGADVNAFVARFASRYDAANALR